MRTAVVAPVSIADFAATTVVVAGLYLAAAVSVALYFEAFGLFPAPVWPAAGVALAACVVRGRYVWPGIFLGSFVANAMLFDSPYSVAAAISLGNTLGPGLGAELMRRAYRPTSHEMYMRETMAFLLLGVALHATITGINGAVTSALAGINPEKSPVSTAVSWFLSDASGALLVAPVALLWPRARREHRNWIELSLLAGLVFALAGARFLSDDPEIATGLPFLVLLPCTWLAMRFSSRDAAAVFAGAIGLAVVAFAAAPGASAMRQAFVGTPVPSLAILGGMLNVLLVSALKAERDEAIRLSTTDGLTGLINRRSFLERAQQEIGRAKRYRRPLVLVGVDLDFFKRVNDRFGHLGGDKALEAIGKLLTVQLRTQDLVARLGGEEFALLLPETDLPTANAVCERLRWAIESTPIEYDGQRIPLTASFGITECRPDDTVTGALVRADAALYEAKGKGRNRVEVGAAA